MYKLGKPYSGDDETASGECCFCGKEITHMNDGGVGYCLEARDEKGLLGDYLYCCYPLCPEARDNDAQEIRRCYNPAHSDTRLIVAGCMGEGWKFADALGPGEEVEAVDCGSYIEFLGDTCPECGGRWQDVDARLWDPSWAEFFAKK